MNYTRVPTPPRRCWHALGDENVHCMTSFSCFGVYRAPWRPKTKIPRGFYIDGAYFEPQKQAKSRTLKMAELALTPANLACIPRDGSFQSMYPNDCFDGCTQGRSRGPTRAPTAALLSRRAGCAGVGVLAFIPDPGFK